MGACTCAACLAKADDATLARMEAALLGLRKAATDEEDLDLDLEDDDAEVMGTVFAVFGNGLGELQGKATTGVELTEADRKQLAEAMKAQIEQGLALLSESGKAKLGPVLEQLNGVLASFADAGTNAIQVGAQLQGLLDGLAAQGGGVEAAGYYSPYEWSRLARTELAFSREAAKEAYYVETYGARTDALDEHGRAPLHPSCECSETVAEDGNGEFWLVIETTPTACDGCNYWADAILASAGLRAMAKRLTPEQREARWEARAARLEATVPKSFKGAMLQVERLSRAEMNRMVYAKASPAKRSATLKNSEVMRYPSATEAHLTNTASSVWLGERTYYGWVVAMGRKALDKGRKVFAWMKDPREPRPQTLLQWKIAIRAGAAVWTHKLKRLASRNWRSRAIQQARGRGTVVTHLRGAVRGAMSDADRVEGQ